MIDNPLSPHAPLNHCPALLVPIMLEVLAAHNAAMPSAGEGIHEKTIELTGTDYDQLLVLYYNAFGSPFACDDPVTGQILTLSFIDKPAVLQEKITNTSRHYTVHMKLMKVPTVPSGSP
jgi:hypothetical protein